MKNLIIICCIIVLLFLFSLQIHITQKDIVHISHICDGNDGLDYALFSIFYGENNVICKNGARFVKK